MAAKLDHGVIGNGRVLALVAPDSGIEWLCLPRFDSPSVFGALLDPERGGVFRFLAGRERLTGRPGYVPNTNVLRTEFEAGDARWEVIDFAPRAMHAGGVIHCPHELVRIVRPLAGTPRITVEFDPRPDYGRVQCRTIATAQGVEVLDHSAPLHLYSNVPGDQIFGRLEIAVRHPLYFMLAYGHRSSPPS